MFFELFCSGRDTQKTQHGIETHTRSSEAGLSMCRDTQKTQHGIETLIERSQSSRLGEVETLRKPSTGLKPIFGNSEWDYPAVETLRKPSTGLKQIVSLATE